jgi:hypothetical protein
VKSLPRLLRAQVKESYAAGKRAIRELLQVWVNMDWDSVDHKLRQVLAWDPDRWALLSLAEEFRRFQDWLQRLYEGPQQGTLLRDYLQAMLASQPSVHSVLGQPPWFQSMMQTLHLLTGDGSVKPSLQQIKHWYPWILTYSDPIQTGEADLIDEAEITRLLNHFQEHLRSWSDVDSGLEKIRGKIPAFHPVCKKLAEGFRRTLLLNFEPETLAAVCNPTPHPALEEACQVLTILVDWRRVLTAGDLAASENILCQSAFGDWQIIHHACDINRRWKKATLPALHAILFGDTDIGLEDQDKTLKALTNSLAETQHDWSQIYHSGIQLGWLDTLVVIIDQMRDLFLAWRRGMESSDDRLERILYQSQLWLIREISARLLKLSRHAHLARLCLSEISDVQLGNSSKLRSLERGLDHLVSVEGLLVRDSAARQIPDWLSPISQILDTPSSEDRRKVVLSLPGNHPLYAWLVDAIL